MMMMINVIVMPLLMILMNETVMDSLIVSCI